MLLATLIALGGATAQPAAEAEVQPTRPPRARPHYRLGDGLTFSFDGDKHRVGLGGFIQPAWAIQAQGSDGLEQFLRVRGAYLNLHGEFFDETVLFFFQTDFSRDEPLLDAWLGFRPVSWLTLSLGQMLTPTSNREQQHMESDLGFIDRSLLSRTFSESGRELGAFVGGDFDVAGIVLRPQLAMTSGDGRNSFGFDSRDRDIGGLKWGGRLDVLPFGDFSEGNGRTVPDLGREQRFKLVLGGAASYNDGVSEARGAGHDEFTFWDAFGDRQQPDYVLIYADLLAKFQGFSLLVEFANSSATSLDGTFTNEAGTVPLLPGEISEFLILGNAVNAQLGYVFDFGLSLDARATFLFAEFDREESLLQDTNAYGGGISYYFFKHALKAQLNYEHIEEEGLPNRDVGELLVQVIL
jgi:hypothetical protein